MAPPHLKAAPEKHDLCIVSADYRLAPQTRLPGIMADIKACIEYLRSPAFASETGDAVDQRKIVVSGGSAGGWLALLLGSGVGFEACGLTPPAHPLGVCAIYPITDITDSFWTTPQHRKPAPGAAHPQPYRTWTKTLTRKPSSHSWTRPRRSSASRSPTAPAHRCTTTW